MSSTNRWFKRSLMHVLHYDYHYSLLHLRVGSQEPLILFMRQAKQCWKFLLRAHDQDISFSNLHVHEHMQLFSVVLRMVPPFATVHRIILRILG